jgi:sortase (surface protein transpeptidase)
MVFRSIRMVGLLVLLLGAPVGTTVGKGSVRAPIAGPQSSHSSRPVRLRIPAINLNEVLWSVGIDKNRQGIVPKHNVGWFNLSARPGDGDNVVLWGHVLRWKDAPRVPAPFAYLHLLKPGARIEVEMSTGRIYQYRVARQVWARPAEVEFALPVGQERLTLISCIGNNVIVQGELTKEFRLITMAEPIPEPPKPKPSAQPAEIIVCRADRGHKQLCLR